jgi:hypothetical protein
LVAKQIITKIMPVVRHNLSEVKVTPLTNKLIDTRPQVPILHSLSAFACIVIHAINVYVILLLDSLFLLRAGTLDALRERMKSIQAAAIGHFDGAQARPLASMNGSNMLHGGTRLDGEPQQQSNIPPMDERALSGLQARMERLKSGSMESL